MIAITKRSFGRISAVISDVDGTLLTAGKTLTERARAAVASLRERNIAFSIVSSRPPRGLSALIEALKITTPIAGFNGAIIASPSLAMIEQHTLSPRRARDCVDFLDRQGIQVWVFGGRDWLVRDVAAPRIAHEILSVQFEPTLVREFGSSLDTVSKIVGVSEDPELLAKGEDGIRALMGDSITLARSPRYYLDITDALANKGAAAAALAKLLATPLGQVAAIGDGANDVPMFKACGLGIAMGNASPDVQRAADFVTARNNDDGFAQAIERIILDGSRTVGASSSPEPLPEKAI